MAVGTRSKLLEKPKTSEKMQNRPHVACAVAGLTADANILLDEARLGAEASFQISGG